MYTDDYESGNPLSSAAGIHKICATYLTLAALPPKYSGTTDNIFLTQLVCASDCKALDQKNIIIN